MRNAGLISLRHAPQIDRVPDVSTIAEAGAKALPETFFSTGTAPILMWAASAVVSSSGPFTARARRSSRASADSESTPRAIAVSCHAS